MLTISGERREEHEEDRDDYYRSERTYGQFYRAIPLPEGVEESQCSASFQDGVLEITFPAVILRRTCQTRPVTVALEREGKKFTALNGARRFALHSRHPHAVSGIRHAGPADMRLR